MTIAITGATSMLGVATIRQCTQKNLLVLAFVRRGSANMNRLPQSPLVSVIECDLDQMADFDAGGLSADVFIHFGWAFTDKSGRNDVEKQLQNVRFTIDAVHLAQRLGCRKFVGAGSQAEYGIPNVTLKPDTPVNPVVPYGVAKYAAGKLAGMECRKLEIAFIWVRILSVYGKNDGEGSMLKQLLRNAANNVPMGLSGCEQVWDYLHEDDAGRAFVSIAERGVDSRVYNLGSGVGCPLKEYVLQAVETVNPDYQPEFGKFPYNPTQPMHLVADISDLTADTGWKPEQKFTDAIGQIRL